MTAHRGAHRELDRRILALGLPALGAIAAEPLYNLVDTAIVGHLGRQQLDALAIATSVLSIVSWLTIFLATATTSAVARLVAARDGEAAGRAVGAAYLLAVALGVLTAVILLVAAPWVAQALGARGGVLTGSVGYLRAAAAGLPFLYVSYAGNGHLIGLADTKTPLRIAVAANVANAGLEAALVFGAHAGLLGSAWGTVIAQAGAAAWYAAESWRRPHAPPRRPRRAEIRSLLRDGHQLSVRTIALGVVPLAAIAVVARLGPTQLAGQQIANRIWYLLSLSLDALAVPAQVFVSAALGAGDTDAARLTGRRTLRLGLAAGVALGVVTAALAPVAPALFTADPAVRHAAIDRAAVRGADPAAGRARVRPRRAHPRHRRLRRDAPRDAARDPRLRPGRGPGAAFPLAGPARHLDRARPVAGRPLGAARVPLARSNALVRNERSLSRTGP